MRELIRFELNGKPVEVDVDNDRMLLWVLRVDLGLTGTKYGCGKSYCGACTVLVGGQAVRNKSVTTIESLAKDGKPHPLQRAFMDNDALQCGYCTPGMILNAYALWENGYIESFNGKLRDELLNGEIFYTVQEAKVLIEMWRRHYNQVRPHSSLGYRPPAPEAVPGPPIAVAS